MPGMFSNWQEWLIYVPFIGLRYVDALTFIAGILVGLFANRIFGRRLVANRFVGMLLDVLLAEIFALAVLFVTHDALDGTFGSLLHDMHGEMYNTIGGALTALVAALSAVFILWVSRLLVRPRVSSAQLNT